MCLHFICMYGRGSWTCGSPVSASQVAGVTGLCHQAQLQMLFSQGRERRGFILMFEASEYKHFKITSTVFNLSVYISYSFTILCMWVLVSFLLQSFILLKSNVSRIAIKNVFFMQWYFRWHVFYLILLMFMNLLNRLIKHVLRHLHNKLITILTSKLSTAPFLKRHLEI